MAGIVAEVADEVAAASEADEASMAAEVVAASTTAIEVRRGVVDAVAPIRRLLYDEQRQKQNLGWGNGFSDMNFTTVSACVGARQQRVDMDVCTTTIIFLRQRTRE